jgi:uncharacterized protein YdhG (YjbR/CyaY superfamily)
VSHKKAQKSNEVFMKAKQANNIDEYIADFPHDARAAMEKVRTAIRKAAPRAEEAIKYQIPTFVLNGNLIHFGGYKNHIGLYPGSKAIEEFKDELSKFQTSKGTVQLPLDKPMPVGLINKITKFCVQRNLAKPRKGTKARK